MIMCIVGWECKHTESITLNFNEKMPSIVAKAVTEILY